MIENLASNWWMFVALGLLTGIIGSALGVGGGALLVPALFFLFAVPQKSAQGIALTIMIPLALVAAIKYKLNPDIEVNYNLALLIAIGAVLGAFIGSELASKLPASVLRKSFSIFLMIVALKMFFGGSNTTKKTSKLNIAVSANMSYVIKEIKRDFEKKNKVELNIVIGSSGKLSTQIMHGAPFDVFLSADMDYPKKLYEEGWAITEPILYARGLLVLFSKKDWKAKEGFTALKDADIKRIVLPNPKLAPYGKAGLELLKHHKLHDELEKDGLIVQSENVTQAVMYALEEDCFAFFSKSSIFSKSLSSYKENENWITCDKKLHTPILQGMVILKDAKENKNAELFLEYMKSKQVGQMMCGYGYLHPSIENDQKSKGCIK